jgi:hypothetical protein
MPSRRRRFPPKRAQRAVSEAERPWCANIGDGTRRNMGVANLRRALSSLSFEGLSLIGTWRSLGRILCAYVSLCSQGGVSADSEVGLLTVGSFFLAWVW